MSKYNNVKHPYSLVLRQRSVNRPTCTRQLVISKVLQNSITLLKKKYSTIFTMITRYWLFFLNYSYFTHFEITDVTYKKTWSNSFNNTWNRLKRSSLENNFIRRVYGKYSYIFMCFFTLGNADVYQTLHDFLQYRLLHVPEPDRKGRQTGGIVLQEKKINKILV